MQRKSAVINGNGNKYIAYLWKDNGCFYKVRGYGDVLGDSFEIVLRSGGAVKGKLKGSEVIGQCDGFDEFCLIVKRQGKVIAKGYSSNYPKMQEIVKEDGDFAVEQGAAKQNEQNNVEDAALNDTDKNPESLQVEKNDEQAENLKNCSQVEEKMDGKSNAEEELGFEGEIATTNYFEKVVNGEASLSATEFLKEKSKEKEKQAFYMELKPQLDKLFNTFPKDEYLTEVIPSSKWVKIEYDNTGKSYSVGVITDGEDVVYIGYGIRSVFTKSPPTSVKSVAQWMPLSFEDVKGEGYWMIYQTAATGENV